jgi:hypothetical protein
MNASDIITTVSAVLIYMGAFIFVLCFGFGAYAFVQIFKTTLHMIAVTEKWNRYHKMSPEAKLDFLKQTDGKK